MDEEEVRKIIQKAIRDGAIKLDLSHISLKNLPPEIGELKSLTTLDLSNNSLESLPPEIVELKSLTTLNLSGNPIQQPPPEIAFNDNNIERIRNYFMELADQGENYIYEAKLILVGEPGAGKTSLLKKLMNPQYELSPIEPMTKGIDVEKWRFPYSDDITFMCNIWDFGGQHIMHSTHRYFLTKRSLYVLVADNRKEDTDFYFWLNILELLSGKSPVIILLNEKFEYKRFVPENVITTFTTVQRIHNVNLANNMGLNDLIISIQQHLCDLDHVGKDPIPKKWVQIRNDLEENTHDYIGLDEYLEICKKNGIEDKEKAGYISEFLHDLGVILHFKEDRILRNTIILNTRWATEAVYEILFDSTVIENGGEFDNLDVERIWGLPQYQNKHGELMQLMLNFELCYEIGDSQKYIVPELLPDKSSTDLDFWDNDIVKENNVLKFEYRYDFMPKGIISRLIVRMNKQIYQRQQWKNGVILQIGDTMTEIVEFFNEKKLIINIGGSDRLETLAIIRKEIKDIHDTYENIFAHEMVPCNCKVCLEEESPHFFDFDELRQYMREKLSTIRCRKGKIKDVSIASLISDVFINVRDEVEIKEGKEIYLDFHPEIKVEGAKAYAEATAHSHADVGIDITININVELPAIQDDFVELKKAVVEVEPGLAFELNRIEDCLDEVSLEDDKNAFKKPMNKMRRLLSEVAKKNSTIREAVKKAKKGTEYAKKVAKTYNKFAQWLALPQVPDLFLK